MPPGVRGSTIVVWASGNGPPWHRTFGAQVDLWPFRGCLGTAHEGQWRMPSILVWPSHSKAGRVSNEIVSVFAFYATFATVVGGKVPTDYAVDSLEMGAFFLGNTPSPRKHFLCFVGDTLAAVKFKQFKMHYVEFSTAPGKRTRIDRAMPQLFNVAADPSELWDETATNLWITESLRDQIVAYGWSVRNFPHVPTGADRPEAKTVLGPMTPRG